MASTLANRMETLAKTLSTTAQDVRTGAVSLEKDAMRRNELAFAASELINSMSVPRERLQFIMAALGHLTAIRLFIQWKAFESIPDGEGASISYAELTAKVGGNVTLITRLGRALATFGTLKQVCTDRVAHTDFSRAILTPYVRSVVETAFDNHATAFTSMSRYFRHFGLVEPTDRLNSVVAFAENKLGSTFWEVIHEEETRRMAFITSMAAFEDQVPSLGNYSLGWAVRAAELSQDKERPLVVDVGGGKGQALENIFKNTPGLPRDRCVLEDLPEVIEAARKENAALADVQMVPVDFHQEQPIKGALVYYIRRCLHDYSDDECVAILRRVADAMASDSRLLIVEMLVNSPPTLFQASLDLMMMTISGKERTLDEFHAIAATAGLRVSQVSSAHGGCAVLECVLA
ncbi:hypothetical protein VTI74DRAFT_11528 [Chaetomium olivicolor]